MTAHVLNITELCFNLERSSNKETAQTVSQAFETLMVEQANSKVEIKTEVKAELEKEFKMADLVTRNDLQMGLEVTKLELQKQMADLELRITEKMSTSKWQIIGFTLSTGFIVIVAPLFLRHFGVV